MVTVLAGVTAAARVLLVLVLQVPALPHLVAVLADQLVAVVLVVQADVHLPCLVTRVGMLLPKPAPHGVGLRGRGQGGAEGRARVVSVAEVLVAGAHSLVIVTVGLVTYDQDMYVALSLPGFDFANVNSNSLTVISLVTEDCVLVADVLLGEFPVLVRRVKAAEPSVIVISVIQSHAESLIPVTRLVGQVGPRVQAVLPVPVYIDVQGVPHKIILCLPC